MLLRIGLEVGTCAVQLYTSEPAQQCIVPMQADMLHLNAQGYSKQGPAQLARTGLLHTRSGTIGRDNGDNTVNRNCITVYS